MATKFFTPILGKRLRATQLTSAGAVEAGPTGQNLVTKGFITVTMATEIEAGAEILRKTADGTLCVNEKLVDNFKRFTVNIEFCGVNPSLYDLISNATGYDGYGGTDVIGFTVGEGKISKAWALELWTGLGGAIDTDEASGYLLLPFLRAGVLGEVKVDGENAVSFSLQGAYTIGGNAWGVGPWDVMKDDLDADAPLPTALDPFDHLLLIEVDLAPPPAATDPTANPV